MNRQQRRADLARRRKELEKMPLPAARADGRPLYFDISEGDQVVCFYCEKNQLKGVKHGRRKAFMNDPANSPENDKSIHTVCQHHLPDDAVIYDPTTNLCRDKSGQNEWMEDKPIESVADDFTTS